MICPHAIYDYCINKKSDHYGQECPGDYKQKPSADAADREKDDAD